MDLPLTRSVKIAILVMPETTASVVYGMFDLFKSAGRDWQWLVEGVIGDALLEPVTVAADSAAFETGNGVKITPHADFESVEDVDILCIPELAMSQANPNGDSAHIPIPCRPMHTLARFQRLCTQPRIYFKPGLTAKTESLMTYALSIW